MTKTEELPQPRNMTSCDLEQIAELHRKCFPVSISIFSPLSDDILKRFYAQVLEEPECVATVLEEPGSGCIVGVAFGTTRPGLQRRFLRRHLFQFCWAIVRGLFVSFALWRLLYMRLRKKTDLPLAEYNSALADAGVPAPKGQEAFFTLVGVHPRCRGGGNAERLVKYFTTQMFEAGAARIRGAIHPGNLASLILHKRLGWNVKRVSATQMSVWIERPNSNS